MVDPVKMPAGIAGDENATVTGELGSLFQVRCLAYGYPPPCVFWYSGFDEAAVVLYSETEYKMRGNNLIIKSLSTDTLGQYTCRAYNGIGQVASWKVVVQAYKPEGLLIPYPWLVPRGAVVSKPGTESSTTVEKTSTTLKTSKAPRLLNTSTGKFIT